MSRSNSDGSRADSDFDDLTAADGDDGTDLRWFDRAARFVECESGIRGHQVACFYQPTSGMDQCFLMHPHAATCLVADHSIVIGTRWIG
ncbi:MAG TPA: hypothetical protein VKP14_06785 [Gaiellaceae bacterium]|nr:hypothetical protein [Gaiellaceae bacterium]